MIGLFSRLSAVGRSVLHGVLAETSLVDASSQLESFVLIVNMVQPLSIDHTFEVVCIGTHRSRHGSNSCSLTVPPSLVSLS